jgi:hypothetical protein
MSERRNIKVKIENPALRKFVISQNTLPIHNDLGFECKPTEKSYLEVFVDGEGKFGLTGRGSVIHDRTKDVTLEEFLAVIQNVKPEFDHFVDEKFKDIVIFKSGDVSYGCTTVSSKVIDEIIKRREALLELWTEKT